MTDLHIANAVKAAVMCVQTLDEENNNRTQ